jgi:hypothetical protein
MLGSCENGIKILDSIKAKNLLIKTATVRLYRRFILQGGRGQITFLRKIFSVEGKGEMQQ